MELIILGSSASYALPGEATSSYLIRNSDHSLLIDIGTGSLSNLFRWQDPANIQALILSHLHVDHFADIYPLRLYLYFERPNNYLTVYAPPQAAKQLGCVLSPKGKEIFDKMIRFKDINDVPKIGAFKISYAKMIHDIDSYAIKIEINGKSMVYSSDTAYNENLVKLAKDADILLAEATFIVGVPGVKHMTVAEAARVACEADVRRLVLTHIWPTFRDKITADEAAKYYSGPIEVASVNKVFKI